MPNKLLPEDIKRTENTLENLINNYHHAIKSGDETGRSYFKGQIFGMVVMAQYADIEGEIQFEYYINQL